jgi:hypothetical protein
MRGRTTKEADEEPRFRSVRQLDERAGGAFGQHRFICGCHLPGVRIEGALFAELAWMSSWKPPRGHLLKRSTARQKRLR